MSESQKTVTDWHTQRLMQRLRSTATASGLSTTPGTANMSSKFTKYDAGKLRMDLIDPQFTEGLAAVLTHGAAKYSADNWKACTEPFQRYYAALQRHLHLYARGEQRDAESGLSHLYHAACCLMFLAHFERTTHAQLEVPNTEPVPWPATPRYEVVPSLKVNGRPCSYVHTLTQGHELIERLLASYPSVVGVMRRRVDDQLATWWPMAVVDNYPEQ